MLIYSMIVSADGFIADRGGPFGFRGGVECGRPLLGAVLPKSVEQRLVLPGRLDRADPLGIVDQQ
ncbi:MAG: hypothetical protein WBB41_10320, partial [Candidatus Nanopelagicales bacterium]